MSWDKHGEQKKGSRVPLDAALLDPALLQDEIVLEDALGVLEGNLNNSTVDRESLLTDLMSKQNLFEFVFAGLSDEVATATKEHITSLFPSNALAFDGSLASSLLARLSQYFWQHHFPAPNLAEHYRWVRMSRSALESLSSLNFIETAKASWEPEEIEDLAGFALTSKAPQRDRKSAKRAAGAALAIDKELFANLKIDPPHSAADISRIEDQLLSDMKDILVDYLNVLRKPDLSDIFKGAYISPATDINTSQDNTIPVKDVEDSETIDVPSRVAAEPAAPSHIGNRLLKPLLDFDLVEGFGDWHILLSSRAQRDLRDARRRDAKRFIIYVKKMRELSNGHFSDDNQKRLTTNDNGVPVFEAKMTGDSRLVYQIDCIREFNDETERQIIKIFGIYTHAQLKRDSQAWTNVSKQLCKKGREYRKRCRYRVEPVNAGDKVFSPAVFALNTEEEELSSSTDLQYLDANEQQDLHERLVLEKFAIFSQACLNNILAEEESAHVFHMSLMTFSPTEQDIVKHLGSCYVLGRSGTGKTTTMIFKMLGIERAHEFVHAACDEEAPRPRQLFVTQSRVLAEKVEEFYDKLVIEQAAAHRTARESTKLATRHCKWVDEALVDEDEEELYCGPLPRFFSQLTDEHFPLFITFDHLCRLLEADINRARSRREDDSLDPLHEEDSGNKPDESADYMLQRRESFVSYITFLRDYWGHLPQHLTKNLDPALVFAEIMGVIKGSKEAVSTEKGFLDWRAYANLSQRGQATFATRREVIYSLFQAYTKKKQERREWDAADRTHSIIRGLREFGVQGKMVDFLYVDEVQDNLLLDVLVLRSVCSNPAGLFWAGDTAQTISAGSSFRFEDLKAFLCEIERSSSNVSEVDTPPEFQLAVNYRSHGGIVNVAYSVIQLITRFWDYAIDALSEEHGVIDGVKPLFFTNWDESNAQLERFLSGALGKNLEFGAHQCILVRDDAARDALRKQVGDIGTILTLYESKGLEFNDVLLYNFFKDSPVDATHWRVLLNALPEAGMKCPSFDGNRHNGLCRELKFLYVAVTRARQNLWIADCSDKGETLRVFWNAKGLIQNPSAADSIPRFAAESTTEEWGQMARTLFHHKHYAQASRSFERAAMPRQRDIAEAYHRRETARRMPLSRSTISNRRREAFHEAAEAYISSASVSHLPREIVAYYRNAAVCFIEASEMKRAGEAFILAEEYTRAAQTFREGGFFDEAMDTIDAHGERIRLVDANKIRNVAKIHYCKQPQDLGRVLALFNNADEALAFTDDFGFSNTRAALLERCGRLDEAAEIHAEQGRTIEAIRMFIRHSQSHPASLQRAHTNLLHGLWRHIPFGVSLRAQQRASHTTIVELLAQSQRLIDARHRDITGTGNLLDEIAMFTAIVHSDIEQLRRLGQRFLYHHHDIPAAVLCLDHVFRYDPKLVTAKLASTIQTLEAFNAYAQALYRMSLMSNPQDDIRLRHLFGFHPDLDSSNNFFIAQDSFLYRYITGPRQRTTYRPANGGGFSLRPEQLNKVFGSSLRERLWSKIVEENTACSNSIALRLCPSYLLFRRCEFPRCMGSHDVETTEPETFEMRNMNGSGHRIIGRDRRYWLSRMYHTLFPVHGRAGSIAELSLASIPEAKMANQVIKEWIQKFLWDARFAAIGKDHFLTALAEVATLAIWAAKGDAQQYFCQSRCITTERPSVYLLKNNVYLVHHLLHFLGNNNSDSLSAGVLFVNIAHRLRRSNSLHNITLARKWIATLCLDYRLRNQSTALVALLVDQLPDLLRELFTGASGFLLHEGRLNFAYQVRHILVARICKSFSLLGYNIPDGVLQSSIVKNIASLSRPDKHYPSLFRRYVNATSSTGLFWALQTSGMYDRGTPEELVNLRMAKRLVGPPPSIKGFRVVVYHQPTEIPILLGYINVERSQMSSNVSSVDLVSTFSMNSQPTAQLYEQDDNQDDNEQPSDFVALPDQEDTGIDHNADLGAVADEIDRERIEHITLTEDKLIAARYLAAVFRRTLRRKQDSTNEGAEGHRYRSYIFYSEGPHAQRLTGIYRTLYFGALPLVWVCLKAVGDHVAHSKKKVRLRLREVQHTEYEKMLDKINGIIEVEKRLRELKSKLGPNSALHRKRSTDELRTRIEEVAALVETLSYEMTNSTEWELRTAMKVVRNSRKPMRKPQLVMDEY
ncbi:hypothetical protein BC629DRAFT_1437282 [Irpex lacteus]|nr:hypothetical protein BC629DRAFT_1437282 [Irpex lacteus]